MRIPVELNSMFVSGRISFKASIKIRNIDDCTVFSSSLYLHACSVVGSVETIVVSFCVCIRIVYTFARFVLRLYPCIGTLDAYFLRTRGHISVIKQNIGRLRIELVCVDFCNLVIIESMPLAFTVFTVCIIVTEM